MGEIGATLPFLLSYWRIDHNPTTTHESSKYLLYRRTSVAPSLRGS